LKRYYLDRKKSSFKFNY